TGLFFVALALDKNCLWLATPVRRVTRSPSDDTVSESYHMADPMTTTAPASSAAQLLDVRAVAALLDCSPRHVYRMSDAGHLPAPVRMGALVRWSRQTIEDWIDGGCKPCRTAGRG